MIRQTNVLDQVVSKGFCIGCGICAGICPANHLSIKFDALGEYKAVGTGPCRENCGICTRVCPRTPGNGNEDDIAKMLFGNLPGMDHRDETGYYLGCYTGFAKDNNFRCRAASGGLTTLFLEQLLKRRAVNGVICVKPGVSSGKLFKFFIANSADELKQAASSAYYPVEMSRVIQELKKRDGNYAVVGLPCFITGLSLAQKQIPELKKKIKFKVGLVCGALLNRSYLDKVFHRLTIHPNRVKTVKFRDTSLFPNRLLGLSIRTKEGYRYHSNYAEDGRIHRSLSCVPTACLFCDDIFAETADIAFMDAWLPAHQRDHLGTTLALVRHPVCRDIMETIRTEDSARIRKTHISQIIESQHPRLNNKRVHLNHRLFLASRWSIPTPDKRKFTTREPKFFEKAIIQARFYRQQKLRGFRPCTLDRLSLLPSQLFEWITEIKLSLKDDLRKHYYHHRYEKKQRPAHPGIPSKKEWSDG